jgi:hypothetical protein
MIKLWRYSKPLFILVAIFVVIQLFFAFQFARFSYQIDHQQPVTHRVATESFPFVEYNMYSGKMDDWNKYSYLKIEADGEDVRLTDMPVANEEQILNPAVKFLDLKSNNFDDIAMRSFLQGSFGSAYAGQVYDRVSNSLLKDKPNEWGEWSIRYLSVLLHKQVHSVQIFNCYYSYNEAGQPVPADQQLVYQYTK